MHWINVIALSLMFFSGLQIFNAHPSLSWGNYSNVYSTPPKTLLNMYARQAPDGSLIGFTSIGSHEFNTTGVFGGLQEFPMLGSSHQIQLVSIWVCEPTNDTAEIAAAFRCGLRTRAMAMQLQSSDDRWYVTALQIG